MRCRWRCPLDEGVPTFEDLVAALDLFRDPILCAVAAGAVLGYLGVLVVLRRRVFVTATLTQAAALGVALGYHAEIQLGLAVPPALAAVVVSLLVAAAASVRAERIRLSPEAVLAVMWICAGALAVIVESHITQEAHEISAILFGSAVLVRPVDLWAVLGIGAVALGVGVWWRRGLVHAAFDPEGARVQGVPVRVLDLTFLVLLTLLVSVSTRALGALPVFGFSVLPAVAALMAAPSLNSAFPLALAGGALAGGFGYLLAFFWSLPVGATETAVAALLVLLALPIRMMRSS